MTGDACWGVRGGEQCYHFGGQLWARLVHRNGSAGFPKAGPALPFRWTNLAAKVVTFLTAINMLAQQRRLVRIKGFDYGDGRLDRLTRAGDQLKVEHYNPCTKYVDDPQHPHVLGRAVREPAP